MSAPILNTLDNELACPRKVPLGFSLDHGQSSSNPFFIQTCINERASLHQSPRSSSCAARRARYSAVVFRAQGGSGRTTSHGSEVRSTRRRSGHDGLEPVEHRLG